MKTKKTPQPKTTPKRRLPDKKTDLDDVMLRLHDIAVRLRETCATVRGLPVRSDVSGLDARIERLADDSARVAAMVHEANRSIDSIKLSVRQIADFTNGNNIMRWVRDSLGGVIESTLRKAVDDTRLSMSQVVLAMLERAVRDAAEDTDFSGDGPMSVAVPKHIKRKAKSAKMPASVIVSYLVRHEGCDAEGRPDQT